MAQEEPESVVEIPSDNANEGDPFVNGLHENGTASQEEEVGDSDALNGSSEAVDMDAPEDDAVGQSDVPDDPAVGTSAAQGFELVEAPTGAVDSEHIHGEAKGILGAAPVISSSGESGEAGAAAEAVKVPVQHTFYLARVPRPDLSDIFSQIAEAEIKLEDKRKKFQFISTAMKLKQSARREVAENRREHRNRSNAISDEVQRKYEEIKPMQDKVKAIRDAGSETRNAGRGLQATSIGELQRRLAEIEYRMQHESIPLAEEKKLLRELQALEKSRPEVEAHEARRSSVSDQQGHQEGLQTQLKPLLVEVEALKQQREAERKIANTFNAEVEALDKEMDALAKDRQAAHEAQEAAYARLKALRQEAYNREVDFRQYRKDLTTAMQFVGAKDVAGLQTFCAEQVERLHSKWQEPPFRKTYAKENERSTLRRFQSLDTRRPGVDEDPAELISAAGRLAEAGPGAAGRGKGGPQANGEGGAKREAAKAPKAASKGAAAGVAAGEDAAEGEAKQPPPEKKEKAAAAPNPTKVAVELSPAEAEAAAAAKKAEDEELAALKEQRREEALAKAKEAEERKKKQAEKAQAKAAARAAKEAEETAKRKEKERQRRERKKAAAAASAAENEPTETAAEGTTDGDETEEVPAAEEVAKKEDDGLTARQRKRNAAQRKKTTGEPGKVAPPQVVKKASGTTYSFWVYFAGIAAFVLLLALAILAASTPRAVKA